MRCAAASASRRGVSACNWSRVAGPRAIDHAAAIPARWHSSNVNSTEPASTTTGTALGTAVSLPETLGQAQSFMSIVANPSPLTLAAAMYLLLFLPLVVASRWIEHASGKGRR